MRHPTLTDLVRYSLCGTLNFAGLTSARALVSKAKTPAQWQLAASELRTAPSRSFPLTAFDRAAVATINVLAQGGDMKAAVRALAVTVGPVGAWIESAVDENALMASEKGPEVVARIMREAGVKAYRTTTVFDTLNTHEQPCACRLCKDAREAVEAEVAA